MTMGGLKGGTSCRNVSCNPCGYLWIMICVDTQSLDSVGLRKSFVTVAALISSQTPERVLRDRSERFGLILTLSKNLVVLVEVQVRSLYLSASHPLPVLG